MKMRVLRVIVMIFAFKFSKCSKCSQTILIIGTVISTTSIYFK